MTATFTTKQVLNVEGRRAALEVLLDSESEANDLFHALYSAASREPLREEECEMLGRLAVLIGGD